jgi:hypothetical protein
MKQLLTITALLLISLFADNCSDLPTTQNNIAHHCNWEDCEQNGNVTFTIQWGYVEGTDGYLCELTHFNNPTWTYEQCEKYVFNVEL